MTVTAEFFDIFRRLQRVLPTFMALTVTGFLVAAFVWRVPPDVLAVSVAVPAIGVFAISRVLILFLPRRAPASNLSAVPRVVFVLAFLMALASVVALDMLISASVLSEIGLPGVAVGALQFSLVSGVACLVALLLMAVTLAVKRTLGVINAVSEYASGLLVQAFWRFRLVPRGFADGIDRARRPGKDVLTLPPPQV
jgi:hypothetical protein